MVFYAVPNINLFIQHWINALRTLDCPDIHYSNLILTIGRGRNMNFDLQLWEKIDAAFVFGK